MAACLSAAGCRSNTDSYSPDGLQQAGKVDRGIITSYRVVDVEGSQAAGAIGGVAAGALVGSRFGGGSGLAIATLGGAVVGGVIGAFAEDKLTAAQAYEYIITVNDGELVSITEKDITPHQIGERVLIIYGVRARIIADTLAPTPPPLPGR